MRGGEASRNGLRTEPGDRFKPLISPEISHFPGSGVATALEHRPAIALIDLSMPDMDGYEVAHALRERLPGVLLIALTGLIRESDRQRASDAGFAYHIAKPASVGQLEALFVTAPKPHQILS